MGELLLEARNLCKTYGGVIALHLEDSSLHFETGKIYGLVGKNGAGKSTLVKIISGLVEPSKGQILFRGEDITSSDVRKRQELGIRICPQEVEIIPDFSVIENLALGDWLTDRLGLIRWKEIRKNIIEKAREYGLDFDLDQKARKLDLAQQRKINIVKVLLTGGNIVILDEPTTSLLQKEKDDLFKFVHELKDKYNITFIFISHFTMEILNYCEIVILLRNGHHILTTSSSELDEAGLVEKISGKSVNKFHRKYSYSSKSSIVLETKQLCSIDFNNINMKVKEGEIVGVVGLPDSGVREFIRALYGLRHIQEGQIFISDTLASIIHPWNAIKSGLCYLSNDRTGEGSISMLSIKNNIGLAIYENAMKRFCLLSLDYIQNQAEFVVDEYAVATPHVDVLMKNLSGGNQQKVCLGRNLIINPKILILDEPTRGIDVESKEDILRKIDSLSKNNGMSFILYSMDYEELCRCVDRCLVFSNKNIIKELRKEDLSISNIQKALNGSSR